MSLRFQARYPCYNFYRTWSKPRKEFKIFRFTFKQIQLDDGKLYEMTKPAPGFWLMY
jgi:hypothetical protein